MKTLSLLFGLLLFKIFFCQAQNPNIRWQNAFGGPSKDVAYSVLQTLDGGFITAGSTAHNGGDIFGDHRNTDDEWIVKLNNHGIQQWSKCYGGTGDEYAQSVKQTKDRGYIVAGYTTSTDGDVTGYHHSPDDYFYDYWVVKLDSIGNIEWENCFGGSDDDLCFDIEQTADGGYVIAGSSYSINGDATQNNGLSDCWIIKLNTDGKLQWQKSYGGSSYDVARSILQLNDGSYIFAAVSYSNDGQVTGHHGTTSMGDYWMVHIDSIGNIIWEKSFGGTGFDYPNSVVQSADGNFAVAGFSNSVDGDVTGNHGGYDYWVIKIDENGSLLNQSSLGGSLDDEANSMKTTDNGGFVIAGYSNSNDGDVTGHHYGPKDFWIVKLNSKLKLKGEVSLGGSRDDIAYDIVETTRKDFVIAGSTESPDGDVTGFHNYSGDFLDDFWVVRLKQSAFSTKNENDLTQMENGLTQDEFNLYPTIATGAFQINLKTTTTTDQLVNIEVFNSIGQLILSKQTEMIDGTLEAKIELNPLLPGGMYFVKTSLSNQQYVGKILLAIDR